MQPNHGIFVENRLRHLVASGVIASTVVAPVPWFPSPSQRFGDWAKYASVAQHGRHGIVVHHPRYPVVPRFGMSILTCWGPGCITVHSTLACRSPGC